MAGKRTLSPSTHSKAASRSTDAQPMVLNIWREIIGMGYTSDSVPQKTELRYHLASSLSVGGKDVVCYDATVQQRGGERAYAHRQACCGVGEDEEGVALVRDDEGAAAGGGGKGEGLQG